MVFKKHADLINEPKWVSLVKGKVTEVEKGSKSGNVSKLDMFVSTAFESEGIDKVTIAQPIAIIFENACKGRILSSLETVNVMLSSENRTKDGCGHYKQLKYNLRMLVSGVSRGCLRQKSLPDR